MEALWGSLICVVCYVIVLCLLCPLPNRFSLQERQAYLCFVTLSPSVFSQSLLCFLPCPCFFPVWLSLKLSFHPRFFLVPSLISFFSPLSLSPVHYISTPCPELFLSCSYREEVWGDSCCSHLCSVIGQWWSGGTGEWASHDLHTPASWQWPEGKRSHPGMEIWPTFGYVLIKCLLTFLSACQGVHLSWDLNHFWMLSV